MKKILVLTFALCFLFCNLCLVSCTEPTPETQVAISGENFTLDLLQSKILKVQVTPSSTENVVVWSSSDEEVVSVNQTGKIVANKIGTATITATVGTASDTCLVTVKVPTENTPVILFKNGIYNNATIKLNDQVQLENVIFYKNTEHTDAEWTYTISNPNVLEIVDGKVIAKAIGQATITAKPSWKGVISDDFTKTITLNVKEFDKQDKITYTDANYFNSYGRTYKEQNALILDLSGTAIEFDFYGTELKINTAVTKGDAVAIRVFIDGEENGKFIKLTNTTFQDITLFDNLTDSAHTVRIVKASPQDIGVIGIKNVTASAFAKATPKSDLLIEFVGDSITVGYSILDEGQGSQNVNNTDASKTYAYTIAKNLNADYSLVCTQGIAVNTTPYLGTTMVDMYKWYSPNKKTNYQHEKSPDVIVINLGTNDGAYLNSNPSHNLANDYYTLLNLIRSTHSDAYIILTYGMMNKNLDVLTAIYTAIDEFDDEKVSFVAPANPSGEGGHPNQTVNDKTAEILTEYIKNLLV